MYKDNQQWYSPALGRNMEFNWYGKWGRPVLMFPTAMARYYEQEDFLLIDSVKDLIEGGQIQVCCVDGVNSESWNNKRAHPAQRVQRHVQYDNYLRNELLPYIQHRAERDDLVVYGASFGAYHATNFALRYPEQVSRCIAFSGVFDVHGCLDGYWDQDCYFHCPTSYVPNLPDDWLQRLRKVEFVVATGDGDHLAHDNWVFMELLRSKGLDVHGELWQGVFGHDWPYWRQHLRRFL